MGSRKGSKKAPLREFCFFDRQIFDTLKVTINGQK